MKVKDYFLTQEEFEIKEINPGILKTVPVPDSLEKYYKSENYISHHQEEKSFKNWVYKSIQKINLKYKKSILDRYIISGKKILDYGCGVGDFLKYIQKDYQVLGMEPNAEAFKISGKKIGKENMIASLQHLENESLDGITLWHVLEHIPNQEEFIPLLISKLKSKGKLIIAVPNFKSYDARFYKNFWAAYDVPRHVFHFSKTGINNIFNTSSTQVIKIKPLIFDSFYISIVSEKYRKNPFFWLKGSFIGLISNFKALKNYEYSSLIYIIEKK